MKIEQSRSIFFFIFAAYAYTYSGTYSYPKRAAPGSPCRHRLLIGIHRVRAEKFRSRIFLRMGGVTLTAKDRASTRPFFHS